LQAGTIEMKGAKLSSPDGKFEVSGTSSLKGELDFKLTSTSNGATATGYTVTGTLAEPRVSQSSNPDTQARLKT
jgi:autotransporter translocation and assembly factor TamB